MDLPEHRRRSYEVRPWWHEAVMTRDPTGNKKGAEIRKSYSRISAQEDAQLREIIANTYGQIALVDHNVGRVLIALAEAGLADSTYVIYFTDHGDWLGDHGLILKGPMHYEGLLRVPAGAVRGAPVSSLDIAPTLFDYSGAAALQAPHGASLRPLIENPDADRDFALNEWDLHPQRTGVALSLRTVRTRTHKLTVDQESGGGELYDLVGDPHETQNLFDDPAASEIRAQLMAYLETRPDDMLPLREPVGMA